jgi:hypothetical protein
MKFSGRKNKRLEFPIPGLYSDDFMDPLSSNDPLIPFLTDENGLIEFTRLIFSVFGPAGVYRIKFKCEGVEIET